MQPWLFAAALSLLASAASAQTRTPLQARCEDTIGESISVLSTREQGYRIDNTRSFYDLTRLMPSVRRGSWVLGLTHTEARVRISVGGRMLADPATGYECVAPRIDVSLDYAPIVVYVSREFPPASCAYREVLAHELRHLTTYQTFRYTHPSVRRRRCCNAKSTAAGCPTLKARWPKLKCCRPRSTRRRSTPAWARFVQVRYSPC
jgi:hypothetical protein